jgi:hypothetical protein
MKKRILIKAETSVLEAELEDGRIAQALWEALPIRAECSTWGEEIYFPIPVEHENDNGQEVVNTGDLGYWPPGRALCIFFGPTPASRGYEIRPASAVTVLGRVISDLAPLKSIRPGGEIVLEELEVD